MTRRGTEPLAEQLTSRGRRCVLERKPEGGRAACVAQRGCAHRRPGRPSVSSPTLPARRSGKFASVLGAAFEPLIAGNSTDLDFRPVGSSANGHVSAGSRMTSGQEGRGYHRKMASFASGCRRTAAWLPESAVQRSDPGAQRSRLLLPPTPPARLDPVAPHRQTTLHWSGALETCVATHEPSTTLAVLLTQSVHRPPFACAHAMRTVTRCASKQTKSR